MIALSWPVPSTSIITQRWGENPGAGYKCMPDGSHNGVDLAVPEGTPVKATADGVVIKADFDATGYGEHVRIQHDGVMSLYGHLSSMAVVVGDHVRAGQVIGESGTTGNSTGPHLHFELRLVADNCKTSVDPLPYLQGQTRYHGIVTGAGDGLRVRSAPINGEVSRYLGAGNAVDLVAIDGDWGRAGRWWLGMPGIRWRGVCASARWA